MALENAWLFLKESSGPTQEHIDDLPPIPEGHQRLYRSSFAENPLTGEGQYPLGPKGEDDWGYEGRWFHPDWRWVTGEYADYPGEGKSGSLENQRVEGKKALMYVDVPEHIEPYVNDPNRSYQHLREKYGMKGDGDSGVWGGLKQDPPKFTKPQVRYPIGVGVAQAGKDNEGRYQDFWLDDSDDFNLKDNVRLVHQWED